jgi:hypothetical protein
LSLHDVLDGVGVLDEGDDAYLCSTFWALKGIYLVDSLDARGPTTPTELSLPVPEPERCTLLIREHHGRGQPSPPGSVGGCTSPRQDVPISKGGRGRQRLRTLP